MSSTYLYSDNDAIYDMSVSSTGTVLSYTDITTQVPLPSTEANANKYLKVRNDGKNLEWAEMELAGGLELILDERTASNPPSICFEDTSGTQYNTGINMYRDTSNSNKETISLYTNNVERLKINEDAITASIFRAGNGTLLNPSYSFTNSNGTDTGMFYSTVGSDEVLNFTTDNYLVLQLRDNFRTQTFRPFDINHSSSASSPALMFAADTTTGIFKPTVSQLAITTNGIINTNFTTTGVDIGTNSNNRNLIVNGNVEANRYRAGNGTVGQPSFSFTTSSGNDTGLYYQPAGDNVDRLVITVGNSGKFTIRETIAPAIRGLTTHINDFEQQGDLNVTGGATNLTGGNVTIGTSGGTSRNLNVNGDLTVSGTIIGAGVGTNNITLTGTTTVDGPINVTGGDLQVGTSGTNRNLNLFGQLNVDGSCLLRGVRNTYGLVSGTSAIHTVSLTGTSYHLAINRTTGSSSEPKTIKFTDLGTAGLGFEFYFYGDIDGSINPVIIENKSGQIMYLYQGGYTAINNDGLQTILGGTVGSFDMWHAHYRLRNTERTWVIRRIKS